MTKNNDVNNHLKFDWSNNNVCFQNVFLINRTIFYFESNKTTVEKCRYRIFINIRKTRKIIEIKLDSFLLLI